jgi:hypothetical protein
MPLPAGTRLGNCRIGPLGKDGMAVLEIVGIGTAASKPAPGL